MTDYSQLVKDLREHTQAFGVNYEHQVPDVCIEAADAIEALEAECISSMCEIALERERADRAEARVAELEAERKRLTTLATDRSYMMEAYRSMLGPKGLEVADMWRRQGVTRQHTSWGPEAWKASGEARAGWLLEVEAAAKTRMEID